MCLSSRMFKVRIKFSDKRLCKIVLSFSALIMFYVVFFHALAHTPANRTSRNDTQPDINALNFMKSVTILKKGRFSLSFLTCFHVTRDIFPLLTN